MVFIERSLAIRASGTKSDLPDVIKLTMAVWRLSATRRSCWLAVMTRPDGDIAQFKGVAFGVAPDLNDFTRLIGSGIDRGFAEARKNPRRSR